MPAVAGSPRLTAHASSSPPARSTHSARRFQPLPASGQIRADDHAHSVCHDCRMATVASRELRNQTRSLLDRVTAGESITITVNGRPAAMLRPLDDRPRWMDSSVFLELLEGNRADAALRQELAELLPDTTDDPDDPEGLSVICA